MKSVPIFLNHGISNLPCGEIKILDEIMNTNVMFRLEPSYSVNNGDYELLEISMVPVPIPDKDVTGAIEYKGVIKRKINNAVDDLEIED